jgi:HNH endonuclease
MKRVRALMDDGLVASGEELVGFQRSHPFEYERLVSSVEKTAFEDVVARFHVVHGSQIAPAIYTFRGAPGKVENLVTLTRAGRDVLISYGELLDYVAVSGWVRFTEGFTTAPRLHDKISGERMERRNVSQWKPVLSLLQNGNCFYGDNHEMSAPEVDHFLPWSFVLEDKAWNLVLACRACNSAKRDRLPPADLLDRLVQRNVNITSRAGTVDKTFLRHVDEWQSRDLTGHVRSLYDQAAVDGFPIWKRTKNN